MNEQVIREIDFTVFVIHRLMQAWKMSAPRVYRVLQDADIIDGYLVPCYDVLHTLGAEYLVEDITDLARERGAAL